jgi:Flp pilus assembly pilin Flp
MGAAAGHGAISNAIRRLAARSDAAGPSLKEIVRDTRGATAIEYAMIASLISILIVGGISQIGEKLQFFFTLAQHL